jgi:hypothetical protein
MTEALGGRRLFLTGAVGASAMLLMGHSPYRRWKQYRALHTVIAADHADAGSFPLSERLAARLGTHHPEWKPVASRAQSAATVLSLLKTRQLDLGLLRAEDSYQAVHGAESDLALPTLRALAALTPEYLFLIVAAGSPVRVLADLKGARLSVVETGRAAVRGRRLIAAAGLGDTDVRWTAAAVAGEAIRELTRGAPGACVLESPSLAPGLPAGAPPATRLRLVSHGDAVTAVVARHGQVYFPALPLADPDGAVAIDGPVLGEARLLVCRADYPEERARAVAHALRGWNDLASPDTPLPIPLHPALADRDTPT